MVAHTRAGDQLFQMNRSGLHYLQGHCASNSWTLNLNRITKNLLQFLIKILKCYFRYLPPTPTLWRPTWLRQSIHHRIHQLLFETVLVAPLAKNSACGERKERRITLQRVLNRPLNFFEDFSLSQLYSALGIEYFFISANRCFGRLWG